MFYLIILILVIFCFYARLKLKWKLAPPISAFGFMFIVALLCFILGTMFLVARVELTNKLKSENINMLPMSVLQDVYNEKVIQLQNVQDKIQKAYDKNQFQVKIDNLNGVRIYTMPMSGAGVGFQGLGDIEKGGAEKLKLLDSLIERQNIIAEELIKAKRSLARPDYYERNAKIMTMENSIFDGWFIKLFTISNNVDINIIENKVYYQKNDNKDN